MTAPEPAPDLHMLSDYAWKAMAYLRDNGASTASETGRGIGSTQPHMMVTLLACEEHRLVQRTAKQRGGWVWGLTAAGIAALAARPAPAGRMVYLLVAVDKDWVNHTRRRLPGMGGVKSVTVVDRHGNEER